jgi:hypothetical protein
MSKLGIEGATALSLALAVATPASAVGFRGVHGGGAMHVGSDGSRVPQASVGSVVSSADAAIAGSLGRTTTRHPGSIWTAMVCGVLVTGRQ